VVNADFCIQNTSEKGSSDKEALDHQLSRYDAALHISSIQCQVEGGYAQMRDHICNAVKDTPLQLGTCRTHTNNAPVCLNIPVSLNIFINVS